MLPDRPRWIDGGVYKELVGVFGVVLSDPTWWEWSSFIFHAAAAEGGDAIARFEVGGLQRGARGYGRFVGRRCAHCGGEAFVMTIVVALGFQSRLWYESSLVKVKGGEVARVIDCRDKKRRKRKMGSCPGDSSLLQCGDRKDKISI